MSEVCVQCKEIIPDNACQQGQKIDDIWYPLHLGCADAWASEELEVWTIATEDYCYTDFKDSVIAEIDNLEEEQELILRKWKMPRLQFLTLPEANI